MNGRVRQSQKDDFNIQQRSAYPQKDSSKQDMTSRDIARGVSLWFFVVNLFWDINNVGYKSPALGRETVKKVGIYII